MVMSNRSDLLTIERVFAERVAVLEREPLVPKHFEEAAHRGERIAGFQVLDPRRVEEVRANGRNAVTAAVRHYYHHRDVLMTRLKEAGVQPLAVLPRMAWRKLCLASKLIFVGGSGPVALNTWPVISRLREGAEDEIRATKSRRWGREGVRVPEHHFEVYARNWVRQQPKADLLEMLMHSREHRTFIRANSPTARYVQGPCDVAEIVLPPPPQDVVTTLLKARLLDLKTVAEPAAIAFTPTLETIIGRGAREGHPTTTGPVQGFAPINDHQAQQLGYADLDEWRRLCPIIYTEHQSAAAVIAQFGDFPIEREVVERAVVDEFLPTADAEQEAAERDLVLNMLRDQRVPRSELISPFPEGLAVFVRGGGIGGTGGAEEDEDKPQSGDGAHYGA